MQRLTPMALLKRCASSTLVVRTKMIVQNLPSLTGKCYGEIAAYLGQMGESPADILFVAYHNMDMQNLDVEIEFPTFHPICPEKETSFRAASPSV